MLVTIEDLTDYMDVSGLSARQEDAAAIILAGLQNELEFIIKRPVELGTYTDSWVIVQEGSNWEMPPYSYSYGLSGGYSGVIPMSSAPPFVVYLEQSPVASVGAVTRQSEFDETPVVVEATDYTVTQFGLYLNQASLGDTISVTYMAGLDGPNLPYFRLVILRAAAREAQNWFDDTVGLKDLNTRNVAPLEIGFNEVEVDRLKRYKRQRI